LTARSSPRSPPEATDVVVSPRAKAAVPQVGNDFLKARRIDRRFPAFEAIACPRDRRLVSTPAS
jgi:hypothetical protein